MVLRSTRNSAEEYGVYLVGEDAGPTASVGDPCANDSFDSGASSATFGKYAAFVPSESGGNWKRVLSDSYIFMARHVASVGDVDTEEYVENSLPDDAQRFLFKHPLQTGQPGVYIHIEASGGQEPWTGSMTALKFPRSYPDARVDSYNARIEGGSGEGDAWRNYILDGYSAIPLVVKNGVTPGTVTLSAGENLLAATADEGAEVVFYDGRMLDLET